MLYTIRSKRIALAMAILFALAIVLPFVAVAPADASASYSSLTKPTVSSGANGVALGTIFVKIDPMAASSTAAALISLPTDYEITVGVPTTTNLAVVTITRVGFDDNEFRLDITKNGDNNEAEVFIPMTVNVPSGAATGDIVADIMGLSGQLVSGKVVVGVIESGSVEVSVSTPEYITNTGVVTITIKENAAEALKQNTDSVKLTLPKGYEWAGNGTPIANLAGDVVYTVPRDGSNNRILYVNVSTLSTEKSIIRFNATIVVDELDAKHGDIEVTIAGKSKTTPSKLVVAKYADFGITLSAEDATEFLAGRMDEEIGSIVVEETAPASLTTGRTILLTLQGDAKWHTVPDIDATHVNLGAGTIIGDNDETVRFVVGVQSTKAGKVIFEEGTINTAVNFKGDVNVKVSGSAGVSGEVVVAKVKAPISATADKPNVKIGVQGQSAGDITITEAAAEALIQGKELEITPSISTGVTFDATPKVEVIEGNIDVELKKSSDKITIKIDGESTVASTIKITGITLTVDRSFPEGDIKFNFKGSAVDEVNFAPAVKLFDKITTAASVINATCVTPAPGDAKQTANFVIGSTTYTVGGVEQSMDVAPYVKDGRTYLPVRYVGYALGVNADKIMWDSATGTVTMIKGDKVVQVVVGSKSMVINGATITMDAAPEINNGRTMLPFRWIAWAFGANVQWDGATQTVTMEL